LPGAKAPAIKPKLIPSSADVWVAFLPTAVTHYLETPVGDNERCNECGIGAAESYAEPKTKRVQAQSDNEHNRDWLQVP
jgi:hypothetical protein